MGPLNTQHFVNRGEELSYLTSLFRSPQSSVIFVRAPSGFGKSSLVDESIRQAGEMVSLTAIVDASMNSPHVALRQGFFIQQTVDALDDAGREAFAKFVVNRGWKTVREKRASDAVRRYPNATAIYSYLVDYFDRLTGSGKFAPEELLKSDSAFAIRICREFLSELMRTQATQIVVREAQMMDHESFEFLLRLQQEAKLCHLVIEYTTKSPEFSADHAKLIRRELSGHENVHILDLQRLSREHLEILLRTHVDLNASLTSEYYARWNGNLHTLTELRYRVGFGRRLESDQDIVAALPRLQTHLEQHIKQLSRHEQFFLVCLLAHISPMHRTTAEKLLMRLAPANHQDIAQLSATLEYDHGLVKANGDRYRIANKDVIAAIDGTPECRGLVLLAKEGLRELYLERLREHDYLIDSAGSCLRSALYLCAQTDAISDLLSLTPALTEAIAKSNDQAAFIDVVAGAIRETRTGFDGDLDALATWAANIAYDTGNFSAVIALLETRWKKSPITALIYAASLMEADGHELAAVVLDEASDRWTSRSVSLGIDLSRAMLARFENRCDEAERRLKATIARSRAQDVALRGFAQRFFESVKEFPDATEYVLESAETFSDAGLEQPEAYSRLASSLHLSREGRVDEAIQQIERAEALLEDSPRAAYLIMNNRAATWLNSPEPEFGACAELLNTALSFAREEYAMTAILSNHAICLRQMGDLDAASALARRALLILENPGYRDRDIQWSAGFNIARILEDAGSVDEAEALRHRIIENEPKPIIYPDYWRIRFGLTQDSYDPKYDHMLAKTFHPLFLSHWQLDRTGLHDLSSTQQR